VAKAPFAAINETRRRKFLVADAEVILFSGKVSREILLTLMSTRMVMECKTATSDELTSEQSEFLPDC
jgi:hypothetical protein